LRRKYGPKCAAACHDGLGRKFCTVVIGARADFAIERFKVRLFEPLAPSAPVAASPSPRVGCKEVQYQCDYLHPCNIFIIRAISVGVAGVLLLLAGLCRRRAIRHLSLDIQELSRRS
jgi:hypothetical protein